MINMAESLRVHSLIARAALHSRASAGGWTQLDLIWHAGGREGGREGREGRGGQGRAGQGRGGQGRGGQGTVHTFHKPEPL